MSIDSHSVGANWEVPSLVVETSRFVYQNGLEAEGIFRISPQMSVVQEVKNALADKDPSSNRGRLARRLPSRSKVQVKDDEPKKYDTISSITQDPHIAAHILKDFLRKIDVPLFPVAVNGTLITAVKERDFGAKIKLYKQVLGESLSTSCRRVLITIGFLAQQVVKHTAENKMSYQALGVVFGPCLIRLDPMQMIEMWDSRICEEIFGNFGAIVEDTTESELQIVSEIVGVPEVKFSKDPPMTAKVTMLNAADMGEGGGKVDLQINVTFIGDDVKEKFELFCACAAKQAPSDPVRAKMKKAYVRPLDSLAMLDTGTKVGVRLTYVFDWEASSAPGPAPEKPKRNVNVGQVSGAPPPSLPPRSGSYSGGIAPPPVAPSGPGSLPPPLVSQNIQLPKAPLPPRALPPPPTQSPSPPPLATASSVPVTRKEQTKQEAVKQNFEEILKNSNVIVLPFSICDPKTLETCTEKWIPALVKLQISAPVVLVGCEKEKRNEPGAEGLVSVEQAKEVPATFSNVEKYVEVSTVTYKGFRTLADAGLDAFLLDYHSKQQRRRVTEVKASPSTSAISANLGAAPPPSSSSSSSSVTGAGAGAPQSKKDKECIVM